MSSNLFSSVWAGRSLRYFSAYAHPGTENMRSACVCVCMCVYVCVYVCVCARNARGCVTVRSLMVQRLCLALRAQIVQSEIDDGVSASGLTPPKLYVRMYVYVSTNIFA